MPAVLILCLLMFAPFAALAEASRGSLFVAASTKKDGGALAMFAGRTSDGLFASRQSGRSLFERAIVGLGGSDVEIIRAIIQEAESRINGYDAVQHGARIKPRKPPTQMTLAQIFDWIDATPGQPHAIGRYQFIPQTLRYVIREADVGLNERFSPAVQDKLADVLLADAGLHKFRAGALGRKAFMNNMAKIWAGLPTSSGKSHYDGYAGNKASVTWARFEAVMAQIAPDRG
jgi:hypothetical protein